MPGRTCFAAAAGLLHALHGGGGGMHSAPDEPTHHGPTLPRRHGTTKYFLRCATPGQPAPIPIALKKMQERGGGDDGYPWRVEAGCSRRGEAPCVCMRAWVWVFEGVWASLPTTHLHRSDGDSWQPPLHPFLLATPRPGRSALSGVGAGG